MERRIAKKCDYHCQTFKNDIKKWMNNNNCNIINKDNGLMCDGQFLQFIYDYEGINLDKEDFQKRKRIKNFVPKDDRCHAKRANGDQCTRRKKEGQDYCGTHTKGTPHGIIDFSGDRKNNSVKLEVWIQEIKGIQFYIDDYSNVYKSEDIIANKKNPAVIATYIIDDNNNYHIPEIFHN